MTNEECFEAWAPDSALWSQWAKPVLFAQFPPGSPQPDASAPPPESPAWIPAAQPRSGPAIIVNLPGPEAVRAGLALAQRGYRPVPLFNGNLGYGMRTVVPMGDLVRELRVGALSLSGIPLPDDAPPAFLLDALRLKGPATPGTFDNRWTVLPQDFPSGTFLASRGIREALLLTRDDGVDRDLAHVLLRWQQAGIQLRRGHPQRDATPQSLTVTPPSSFRRAWYRVIALFGLRRGNVGGFGALISEPGTGGFGG